MREAEQPLAQRKHSVCRTGGPQAVPLRGNLKGAWLTLEKLICKGSQRETCTESLVFMSHALLGHCLCAT